MAEETWYWWDYILCIGIIMSSNLTIIYCDSSCVTFGSVLFRCCGFGKPFQILHLSYFKSVSRTFFSVHACVLLGDFCYCRHITLFHFFHYRWLLKGTPHFDGNVSMNTGLCLVMISVCVFTYESYAW